ncbi:MAG: hypothetical protein HY960_15810 [Ignavibacteriae bacterium]|nr:hypothetical protein [Ignavibacteriota bacterium]
MSLYRYLNDGRNSLTREKLANYRFFYEVKVAAVKGGSDIQISLPEIDKEGYDVVLDDGDEVRLLQLKTAMSESTTSQWDIQKQLLRPDKFYAEKLGFELSSEGVGLMGGVVLISIGMNNTKDAITTFHYSYCDIFTLKAFEFGFFSYTSPASNTAVKTLISSLTRGRRHQMVTLTRSAFIKVDTIDNLLAIANLNAGSNNQWRIAFDNFLFNRSEKHFREQVLEYLCPLVNDKRIRFSSMVS